MLFLVYTWLACTYGFLFGADVFVSTWGDHSAPRMSVVAFSLLTGLLGLLTAGMAGFYVYLAATNQTAIDNLVFADLREKDAGFFNPYSRGSVMDNWRATLLSRGGAGWWELVVPPWPSRMPASGPF